MTIRSLSIAPSVLRLIPASQRLLVLPPLVPDIRVYT